jgi:hypothetical protein
MALNTDLIYSRLQLQFIIDLNTNIISHSQSWVVNTRVLQPPIKAISGEIAQRTLCVVLTSGLPEGPIVLEALLETR